MNPLDEQCEHGSTLEVVLYSSHLLGPQLRFPRNLVSQG